MGVAWELGPLWGHFYTCFSSHCPLHLSFIPKVLAALQYWLSPSNLSWSVCFYMLGAGTCSPKAEKPHEGQAAFLPQGAIFSCFHLLPRTAASPSCLLCRRVKAFPLFSLSKITLRDWKSVLENHLMIICVRHVAIIPENYCGMIVAICKDACKEHVLPSMGKEFQGQGLCRCRFYRPHLCSVSWDLEGILSCGHEASSKGLCQHEGCGPP